MKNFIITVLFSLFVFTTVGLAYGKADPAKAPVRSKPIRRSPMTEISFVKAFADDLWVNKRLGKSGLSCSSCHLNGIGLKSGDYPKFIKMAKDILTLDQMINFCITNPMKGKELKWKSHKMTGLAYYVSTHSNEPEAGEVVSPPARKPPVVKQPAANPCAVNPCAVNPCAVNPCAVKPPAVNPPAVNPCATNPCSVNPCAVKPPVLNPCAVKLPVLNPCAVKLPVLNPCAVNPCATNPCSVNPCAVESSVEDPAINPCAVRSSVEKAIAEKMAVENPCATNPCSTNPCSVNPSSGN